MESCGVSRLSCPPPLDCRLLIWPSIIMADTPCMYLCVAYKNNVIVPQRRSIFTFLCRTLSLASRSVLQAGGAPALHDNARAALTVAYCILPVLSCYDHLQAPAVSDRSHRCGATAEQLHPSLLVFANCFASAGHCACRLYLHVHMACSCGPLEPPRSSGSAAAPPGNP